MGAIAQLVEQFVGSISSDPAHIYNEFSLQHELGIFLRGEMPDHWVQFERNVSFFFRANAVFTKREIDISVYSPDKQDLRYAIELKYPRNGQHPEQMFSFCKDISFVEQLHAEGFRATALVIFADDPLFYRGSTAGIYGFFRGGQTLQGRIQKPTGSKDAEVNLSGSYVVQWKPISGTLMFAVVEVGGA